MNTSSLYGVFHADIWRLLLGHFCCYGSVKKTAVLNSVFSVLVRDVLAKRKYQRRTLGFIGAEPVQSFAIQGGHSYTKCLEFLPDGRPVFLKREPSKERNRPEGRLYICDNNHGIVPLASDSNRHLFGFIIARNKQLLYECRIEDREWYILEFFHGCCCKAEFVGTQKMASRHSWISTRDEN